MLCLPVFTQLRTQGRCACLPERPWPSSACRYRWGGSSARPAPCFCACPCPGTGFPFWETGWSAHAPAATPGMPSWFKPVLRTGRWKLPHLEMCVWHLSAPRSAVSARKRCPLPRPPFKRTLCVPPHGHVRRATRDFSRRHQRGPVLRTLVAKTRVLPPPQAPSPPRRDASRCIRGGARGSMARGMGVRMRWSAGCWFCWGNGG